MIMRSENSSNGIARTQACIQQDCGHAVPNIPGEQRHYASTTINLRLAAVSSLAYQPADCGLLSADLAAGIRWTDTWTTPCILAILWARLRLDWCNSSGNSTSRHGEDPGLTFIIPLVPACLRLIRWHPLPAKGEQGRKYNQHTP